MDLLPDLPVPSSPDPIGVESAADVALRIVRDAGAIRPPAGLIRLEARLRSGQASAGELARLMDGSPALAARLLRMANSAFYSPLEPVVSLHRALVVIGDAVLSQLVIHAIVASRRAGQRSPADALAGARLMSDGVRSAVACRALASLTRTVPADDAFSGGLLHDLGHVILLDSHPQQYAAYLLERIVDSEGLIRELGLTGTTHEAVGEAFALEWNLPASLREAMGNHHRLSASPTATIVRLSDLLMPGSQRPAFADLPGRLVERDELMAALGIDPAAWAERLPKTQAEMAELLTIFDLAA